jgi:hypothetical protein
MNKAKENVNSGRKSPISKNRTPLKRLSRKISHLAVLALAAAQ